MNLNKLALAILLLISPAVFAQETPKADLGDTLRKATIAVYQGRQECKYHTVEGWFGELEQEWGCKFVSHFTCTGTIIANQGSNYIGLTAGHCFDHSKQDEYYISESVGQTPVLKHIDLQKFENDERYDYAIFEFQSAKDYPAIPVDIESANVVVGTEVLNVNFAFGLVKQTAHGLIVSELITTPAIKNAEDLKGRFLLTLSAGPGASGSAIVDAHTGKIIGIVEAMFPATQMPMVGMPTGQSLVNFMEDDSAGLEPQPEPKKIDPKNAPSKLEHKGFLRRFFGGMS